MLLLLFRVSILPVERAELFSQSLNDDSRYRMLVDALLKPKGGGIYRNIRYRIYNAELTPEGAVVGRLSHPGEIDRTIPDATGLRLRDITEDTEDWVHFLFYGKGEQVLAVQKNADFFSGREEGLVEILQSTLNAAIDDDRVQVVVQPLTRPGTFWAVVERATELFEVSFVFVAPNMFGGKQPLTKLLTLQTALHNASLVKAGVENPDGTLRYDRNDATEAEVAYAEAGGGSWKVDMKDKEGPRRDIRSGGPDIVTVAVEDDDDTKQSLFHKLEGILTQLRKWL